jgi:hypothetical protein
MEVRGGFENKFEPMYTSKSLSDFKEVFEPKQKYNFMVLFNLKYEKRGEGLVIPYEQIRK